MKIAYGFWRYGPADIDVAIEMFEAARNAGITHFDTADVYGYPDFGAAEALLGEIRIRAPSLLNGIEVATKAGVEIGTPYNSSRAYLDQAIHDSLARLKTDCIDLFYIHRPDFLTHPEDVAEFLDNIVASGKAKAVGVSNYSVHQLNAVAAHMKTPLRAHQVEFSPLHVEPVHNGVFDKAMAHSMDVYAWSPLGGGRLFEDKKSDVVQVRNAIEKVAAEREWSLTETALAFVLSHPARPTAIIGTRKPARLQKAANAAAHRLSRKEWYEIYQASLGEGLP